jgi:hypothetical protein
MTPDLPERLVRFVRQRIVQVADRRKTLFVVVGVRGRRFDRGALVDRGAVVVDADVDAVVDGRRRLWSRF